MSGGPPTVPRIPVYEEFAHLVSVCVASPIMELLDSKFYLGLVRELLIWPGLARFRIWASKAAVGIN